nr:MAG TPA: hypothetical protein [Caudoviricetes sp.]
MRIEAGKTVRRFTAGGRTAAAAKNGAGIALAAQFPACRPEVSTRTRQL